MAKRSTADSTEAVDEFLRKLDHPLKGVVEVIRGLILGADSRIAEGIKWNAPSFRTTEYFATTNLRLKGGIGVILHLGAKVRDLPGGLAIEDPAKLLKWLARDRASVEFSGLEDLADKQEAFQNVIREWIRHVRSD